MPRSISPEQFATLAGAADVPQLIDVRKAPARALSGLTIAGAERRLPSDAEDWWAQFAGRRVVVFCVHGHEVSQAVAGFLADKGIDVAFLEGGFEAWRTAGLPIEATGDAE